MGEGGVPIPSPADPRLVYEGTDAALWALRTALRDLRFTEVLPAVLSSRFEPGARHSVAVLGRRAVPTIAAAAGTDPGARVRVEGERAYFLPVSHAVEKQIAIEHLQRVWCMTPCVRLLMPGEPSSRRHLYTFFQVEIEWRTEDVDEVFATTEDLLQRFALALRPLLPVGLAGREGVEERLRSLAATPYPRVAFRDALARVRAVYPAAGRNPHNENDLTHDEERRLSESFRVPFWLHDYPEGVRDSVYRRNASGTYDTYDLLLPFGVGEVLTGGLRAESGAEIVRQSKALTRAPHPDYAVWKDRTGVQSGGFGIGFERLVRYALAFPSILDVRRAHDSGPNATIEAEAGS